MMIYNQSYLRKLQLPACFNRAVLFDFLCKELNSISIFFSFFFYIFTILICRLRDISFAPCEQPAATFSLTSLLFFSMLGIVASFKFNDFATD